MLTPRYQRLKTTIANLAGTDVGVYEVAKTPLTTIPAIKIVPPEPESHWIPVGLEIVVERVPNIVRQTNMHWNAVKRLEEWAVILTQYDREEYDVLTNVSDRILLFFGSAARRVYRPQSEKTYERATIYIQLWRYLKS